MKKRILIVFGTRPEAIKMCPLVKEFESYCKWFHVEVCVSGQHREMLDQVLTLFNVIPNYDLDIMKANQDLYQVTASVLMGMKKVLEDFNPDVVLVHGDTTTSFAASIASFYKKIPVGHVEAGLRTWNILSPWPEELNRQVTSRVSKFHFAPTPSSRDNLLREHCEEKNILVTGNTVIDALFEVLDRIDRDSNLKSEIISTISSFDFDIRNYQQGFRRMILITGHRRENFGDGFREICEAIRKLALSFSDVDFIYPVHLNPNVQKPVRDILSRLSNVFLIDPLKYGPFIFLMRHCYMVLTDSGGIQEEAPSLGKPVLVFRDTTERPEAVLAGTVKMVGTDGELIYREVANLLTNPEEYSKMSRAINPYGDGKSCRRIVEFLKGALDV